MCSYRRGSYVPVPTVVGLCFEYYPFPVGAAGPGFFMGWTISAEKTKTIKNLAVDARCLLRCCVSLLNHQSLFCVGSFTASQNQHLQHIPYL